MSGFDPRMMQGAMPGGGQPPMGGGQPPGGGQRYQQGGGQMGGQGGGQGGGGQRQGMMDFRMNQLQNQLGGGRKDPRQALIEAQWSGNPMQIAAAQLAVDQWEEDNRNRAMLWGAEQMERGQGGPNVGGGQGPGRGRSSAWIQAMMQQMMGGGGGGGGGGYRMAGGAGIGGSGGGGGGYV